MVERELEKSIERFFSVILCKRKIPTLIVSDFVCSQENFPEIIIFLLFFLFLSLIFFFKLAIQLDKVNCKIYCLWSLLDNFEWIQGYNSRFGLFHVDFEDPARPRVPYTSAKEYAKLIQNNGLEEHP